MTATDKLEANFRLGKMFAQAKKTSNLSNDDLDWALRQIANGQQQE